MSDNFLHNWTQSELDLLNDRLKDNDKIEQLQKQVDIAVRALRKLKECMFQGGEQSVKLGVRVIATAALVDMGFEE